MNAVLGVFGVENDSLPQTFWNIPQGGFTN